MTSDWGLQSFYDTGGISGMLEQRLKVNRFFHLTLHQALI